MAGDRTQSRRLSGGPEAMHKRQGTRYMTAGQRGAGLHLGWAAGASGMVTARQVVAPHCPPA